jgi:hypothetical protein
METIMADQDRMNDEGKTDRNPNRIIDPNRDTRQDPNKDDRDRDNVTQPGQQLPGEDDLDEDMDDDLEVDETSDDQI